MHLSFRASKEMVKYIDFLVKLKIVESRSEFIRMSIKTNIMETMHFAECLLDRNRDLEQMMHKVDVKNKLAIKRDLLICTVCNKPIEDNEYSEYIIKRNCHIMHRTCYNKQIIKNGNRKRIT